MRPAGRQSFIAISETPNQTSNGSLRIVTSESLDAVPINTEPLNMPESLEADQLPATAGFVGSHSALDPQSERRRRLAVAIYQRIETRLAGRVRDLEVHVQGSTVVLEGRCATYYTKQLAQHAALGVIDDEQLENAIVVMIM